jgi:AAA family ATP:ADP antiporter
VRRAWSAALDLRPGEPRLVGLLFVHSFLIGVPRLLTSTAAMALFLTYYNASHLPYIYMGAAVAIPLTGFLRLRLASRLSFVRLLALDLGLVLVVLVVFRLLLSTREPAWVAMVLPVWYEVEWVLLNLEFWGLAGHQVNVRQAKRLFGVIGTGELVAGTVAGLAVPTIVDAVGTPNLLLISAAAVALCLGLLALVSRAFPIAESEPPRPPARERSRRRYADLLQSRYVLLLFALIALSYLGYFVLDNAFYSVAHAHYPDANHLASFLGVFWAIVALVTLLSRTIFAGRVLTRYGLIGGLLALPAAVAAGVSLIAVSTAIGAAAGLVFWCMALTKLFDQSLRDSIDRSAVLVLYQPLPGPQRVRVQTAVEGIVGPLAGGVSGLTLLFLIQVLHFQAVHLTSLLLVIVAAWIVVAARLRGEYSEALSRALARRGFGGGSLSLGDASTVDVLRKGLRSPHAAEVLYCLEALESVRPASQEPSFPALLGHPSPQVRREVLLRIERLGLTAAAPLVRARTESEPDPDLRGVALRVLAAIGEADDIAAVQACADDAADPVRRGAMAGLLRRNGAGDVLARLNAEAIAPEPARRLFAARVIGDAGVRELASTLAMLLRDEHAGVRRAALATAGTLGEPRLLPVVVDALAEPSVRSAAVSTLLAAGDAATDALIAAYEESDREGERARGRRLIRVLARAGDDRATAALWRWASGPDAEVRDVALPALGLRARPLRLDSASVRARLEAEAAEAAVLIGAMEDVGSEPALALLRRALDHELERARERILWLLSLLYAPEAVLRARAHLSSRSPEKRAQAVELIDSLAEPALAELVVPIVEDVPADVRRARLAARFPMERRARLERLREVIGRGLPVTAWTRACALHAAGETHARELLEAVRAARRESERVVREAAAVALVHLDGTGIRTDGGDPVMTTIEKVLVLKSVSIFSDTPDEILADVASLLEEVEVDAGEPVFQKGDVGTALYIVVEGRVRVTSQDRVLAELGPRDIFGEMAALDPEPRSASVSALEPTSLFRLEQESLYELMADRIEVVRGVIRVLCGRLRTVTERETTGWGRVLE